MPRCWPGLAWVVHVPPNIKAEPLSYLILFILSHGNPRPKTDVQL
jgi:hypothetical protein